MSEKIDTEKIRDAIVKHVIGFLKRFKDWSDEQITGVDVDVSISPSKVLTCAVKVSELDMDSKYVLCSLLTGVMYSEGIPGCTFELVFPDILRASMNI